tara:strand:+ start:2452 stop:2652 length:201 start_codon:yes stop_codon:yes gene_type:complete
MKYKKTLVETFKKTLRGVRGGVKLVDLEVKLRKLELENAELKKKLKEVKYRFDTLIHQCKQYSKDL